MSKSTRFGLLALGLLVVFACNRGVPEPDRTDQAPVLASGDLPCDVAQILKARCSTCHSAPPSGGAPMSLLSAADFQADRGGRSAGAATVDRIQNAAMPMPPAALGSPLSASEIAALRTWIESGATPVTAGCSAALPQAAAGVGGGGSGGGAAGGSAGSAGALSAGTGAGTSGTAGSTGADAGTPLPDAAATERNWAMFGHDLLNSRDNPSETTIGPGNAATLHRLWSWDGPGTTSTPALVDDVIYLPGWDGKVYALRADNGAVVWTATLPDLIDSSPAVTAERVFVSDDAGSVHALERATGATLWSVRVDPHPEAHLWSSPVFIEDADLVVIGVASSEEVTVVQNYVFRGSVVALDAGTGQERWRFYTTDNDAASGSGIAVWATAAVDTQRKLLFIGTGNNYTGAPGPYADSMLAIAYESGELRWFTQFTQNDVFSFAGRSGPDFDIGASANLFSAGGQDLVGIGVKSGIYYALERDAGTIVWMTELTPGGVLGGVIGSSAYANGAVFVASNDQMAGQTRTFGLNAADGRILWMHEAAMSSYGGVAHANGVVYMATTAGTVFALDAEHGTELWSDVAPDAIAAGPIVAGGMLLLPWGYQFTLRQGNAGRGGLIAYGP